jgi:hypothetical protein
MKTNLITSIATSWRPAPTGKRPCFAMANRQADTRFDGVMGNEPRFTGITTSNGYPHHGNSWNPGAQRFRLGQGMA